MKKIFIFTILIITLNAGIYTNKLAECMVTNSTKQDIKMLKTWMFFAFAQDPDLKPYNNISSSQKEAINKKMGAYVTALLTEKCKNELKKAVKFEGLQSISKSFEYLGKIAGIAITSTPPVKIFFKEFGKYLDMKKFNSITK